MTADEIIYIDTVPRLVHRFLETPEMASPKNFNKTECAQLQEQVVWAFQMVENERSRSLGENRPRYKPLLDAIHMLKTAIDTLRSVHTSDIGLNKAEVWVSVRDVVLDRCCNVRHALDELAQQFWPDIKGRALKGVPGARW